VTGSQGHQIRRGRIAEAISPVPAPRPGLSLAGLGVGVGVNSGVVTLRGVSLP
jgi:hypothetical protein